MLDALQQDLTQMLAEIRQLLDADVAWMLVGSPVDVGLCVVAASTVGFVESPVVGECVRVVPPPREMAPTAVTDLLLVSLGRPLRVRVGAALMVPWAYSEGVGLVVAGVVGRDTLPVERGLSPVTAVARRVGPVYATARTLEQRRLSQGLLAASSEVRAALLDGRGNAFVLQTVLAAARRLFVTDVAYLSLSEGDAYTFAATLGIRTSGFRRLRLDFEQGLGGLARRDRATIRTFEYGHDHRFRRPPVTETRTEGIRSAMCAPVIIDNEVAGTLYVGNRALEPFHPECVDVFAEFAELVAAGLRNGRLEEHRLAVIRREEREQLARALHDNVVRSLVRIGFEAEIGLSGQGANEPRQRLAAIARAAESCLEVLRESLASFTAETALGPTVPVAEMLAIIDAVPPLPGHDRRFRVAGSMIDLHLDRETAEVLISIGHEALANANIHSAHRRQLVAVDVGDEAVTLMIADDGAHLDECPVEDAFESAAGHFGIKAMRASAERLGGVLRVGRQATGRWLVRATIPRHTFRGRA